MKMTALAALPALLALSPPASAPAAGPVLGDLVLGEQLAGPKLTVEDLEGSTVLAYFWSIH